MRKIRFVTSNYKYYIIAFQVINNKPSGKGNNNLRCSFFLIGGLELTELYSGSRINQVKSHYFNYMKLIAYSNEKLLKKNCINPTIHNFNLIVILINKF